METGSAVARKAERCRCRRSPMRSVRRDPRHLIATPLLGDDHLAVCRDSQALRWRELARACGLVLRWEAPRIRPVAVSETYKFPTASTATPSG